MADSLTPDLRLRLLITSQLEHRSHCSVYRLITAAYLPQWAPPRSLSLDPGQSGSNSLYGLAQRRLPFCGRSLIHTEQSGLNVIWVLARFPSTQLVPPPPAELQFALPEMPIQTSCSPPPISPHALVPHLLTWRLCNRVKPEQIAVVTQKRMMFL